MSSWIRRHTDALSLSDNMALATPHLLLPKICSAILILLKDGFVYSFKNYDRRTSTCAASCLGKHSAAHWCKNFINNLLQIRHLHSIVHNNTKHFFDEDSRTRSLQCRLLCSWSGDLPAFSHLCADPPIDMQHSVSQATPPKPRII